MGGLGDKMSFDKETKQRIFQQVMDIWVNPEVERRIKEGIIKKGIPITKMQIIFSLDDGNKIRLNEEVKSIITGKTTRDIKKGEIVYETDINQIENIQLTEEDGNCGHITLLLFKDNWIIRFDAIYNKEVIKKHIEASKEFYESAKENLEKNRLRPFYENSFAVAELSAKGILLTLPDKKILEGKNHRDRLEKFKNWAELGNVKTEFNTILSKLNSLRSSARYLSSDNYQNEDPQEILKVIEEMIKFAEENIK
jgi:HEPN domain-containing protein